MLNTLNNIKTQAHQILTKWLEMIGKISTKKKKRNYKINMREKKMIPIQISTTQIELLSINKDLRNFKNY